MTTDPSTTWKTIYNYQYSPQVRCYSDDRTCYRSTIPNRLNPVIFESERDTCRDAKICYGRGGPLSTLRPSERDTTLNTRFPSTALQWEVVIIKWDERNRGKWKLGIVEKLIPGRDQVVRAVRLRAGKSYLERPVQHLFPLELSCDRTADETQLTALNVDAPAFAPKRAASQVAEELIREIAEVEEQ